MEEKVADIGPWAAIQSNSQADRTNSCAGKDGMLDGSILPFGEQDQRKMGANDSGLTSDLEETLGTKGKLFGEFSEAERPRKKARVTPTEILSLLTRQEYRCAYTNEPLTPDNVGADHINPASKNGAHEIGNIALVLSSVNRAKGSMSLDEFVSMCRLVTKRFDGHANIRAAI